MNRTTKILLFVAVIGGAGLYGMRTFFVNVMPSGQPPSPPDNVARTKTDIPDMEIVMENLTIPWDVAFLPTPPTGAADGQDSSLLITERTGNLVALNLATGTSNTVEISDVRHTGEGGLLGIVLHPAFDRNGYIYVYFSTSYAGGTVNEVYRFIYKNGLLADKTVILNGIPGAAYHDGGRMAFGPDGMLYVTTGDAGDADTAQDKTSLAGKILRVRDDGSIPADNPFGNAVYSYGHRNPQGITWDADGNLWSTEHGRSGVLSGLDELNRIVKGGNYGWPDSQGDSALPGTIAPALHSGTDTTWAPASALYWDGSIFFGGLRGETLYEAVLDGKRMKELRKHYVGAFGRIRTVAMGGDGMMYLTTSNRDGRGDLRPGDDKLIRLNPKQFR